MILSNSIISNLEQRDIENSLEVEHLLELLSTGDQFLVAPLQELSARRNWKEINNDLIIPFATWANILCDYFSGGIEKLIEIGLAKDRYSDFAVAALAELKTEAAVSGLLTILASCSMLNLTEYKLSIQCISSLNQLLSFNTMAIAPALEEKLRQELETKIQEIDTSTFATGSDVAICLCALRGVGNEETVKKIKQRPPLQEATYQGLEKLVIKAIQNR